MSLKQRKKMEKNKFLNILVVDDEEEICKMFTKFLSREGHRVKASLTGDNAIDLINKEKFNVVFLDIVMPGMPTIAVLEKIKKTSPNTKVVLITGKLVNKNFLYKMKRKGVSELLQKPFKIEDLREIVC